MYSKRCGVETVVFGLQVHHLSADHAVDGASGVRDLRNDGHTRLGRALQLGEDFVGVGLQAVPGENRDGIAKHFVGGGAAAAQVIVVEGRQVVVDERVGMQHFQRGAQVLDAGRNATGDNASGFHAEDGAQAFASGKYAVAHRLMNGRGILRGRRKQPFQGLVGDDASLFEDVLEHEKGSITTARVGMQRRGAAGALWKYGFAYRECLSCGSHPIAKNGR